eukprot:TRINITY_DN6109_c0_g1_i3.p1 TRINITY_DN6109_c0_g1~~TRINITY_DN6109_c0_g1_i3.p1  ORF type:complete len:407 (+),score=91.79 TRINITY_DN6109_c0_g1_i3:43-1221(+)
MPLVSEKGAKALRNYKYAGSDNSLILKYILRHYFDVMHRFFPRWMAPNLITLVGFSFITIAHILFALWSPTLREPVPAWLAVVAGLAVHLYQLFDNIDGRQARATGTSSPLGHIFDHGCDALSVTVTGLNLCVLMGVSPLYSVLSNWGVGMLPFFFATWEEYHTGMLVLPFVNGPIEGILIITTASFVTAVVGQQMWMTPIASILPVAWLELLPAQAQTLALSEFLVSVMTFLALVTVCTNVFNALAASLKKGHSLLWVLGTTLPFLMLTGSMFYYAVASPLLVSHPRLVLWIFGLAFADLVTRIILAHLTHEPFPILTQMVVPTTLLSVLSAVGGAEGARLLADPVVHQGLLALFVLLYVVFIGRLVFEFTSILNIRALTIPPEKYKPKSS